MRNKQFGRAVFYVIMCAGLVTGYHCFFSSGSQLLENLSSYIMYPILVAQHKIVTPIKSFFAQRRTVQEFETLVAKLESERDELIDVNVQLNAMLSFIQETKDVVNFKKNYVIEDAIVAQVLVKHFSDQGHYFLLDKGASTGIQKDMVAVYKNCLLGKVVEVFPHYSKIILITDTLCKVAAYCAHTRASGIHEGNNQEYVTGLKYVSHLADVEPDDLVLSSGDGLVFPKGFALGKIKSCTSEGLLYDVIVEPLVDMRKIDYCCMLQKGAEQGLKDQALITLCEKTEHDIVSHDHDNQEEQHIHVASQQDPDALTSTQLDEGHLMQAREQIAGLEQHISGTQRIMQDLIQTTSTVPDLQPTNTIINTLEHIINQ